MNPNTTICAVSTAPGVGGVAVIRVSGPNAFSIVGKIFKAKNPTLTPENMPAYNVRFGQIFDENNIIDDVLLTIFHAPHSFTGENVAEIACHGSQFIQQEIIRILLKNGCTFAAPGEFTQRAFMNGKMDLSQAEAVADLIASQNAAAHKVALSQMRGGFSTELQTLREKLLHFTSLVELELDFADHEELNFADRSELSTLANSIQEKISRLANSFQLGNAIKNGIPVAIVGQTNAGKSTLLNALVGEERAIVSDIHGTTRDVIEDCVNLHGVSFRFIDTAGIRSTTDSIENLGIERSKNKIQQAQIILWIIDSVNANENTLHETEIELLEQENKPIILIFNKIDLAEKSTLTAIEKQIQDKFPNAVTLEISAKKQIGLTKLTDALYSAAQMPEIQENDVLITNLRHYEALTHALTAIERVQSGLQLNISGDLLSQDLRECLHHLAEITGGEITSDEVLGNIFKHFCIGK